MIRWSPAYDVPHRGLQLTLSVVSHLLNAWLNDATRRDARSDVFLRIGGAWLRSCNAPNLHFPRLALLMNHTIGQPLDRPDNQSCIKHENDSRPLSHGRWDLQNTCRAKDFTNEEFCMSMWRLYLRYRSHHNRATAKNGIILCNSTCCNKDANNKTKSGESFNNLLLKFNFDGLPLCYLRRIK